MTAISRRDVLNGTLLAAGGALVTQSVPLRIVASALQGGACDGPIGADLRAPAWRQPNAVGGMRDGHPASARRKK